MAVICGHHLFCFNMFQSGALQHLIFLSDHGHQPSALAERQAWRYLTRRVSWTTALEALWIFFTASTRRPSSWSGWVEKSLVDVMMKPGLDQDETQSSLGDSWRFRTGTNRFPKNLGFFVLVQAGQGFPVQRPFGQPEKSNR